MSNQKLWLLCGIVALIASLTIMQMMAARSVRAADPTPDPNPNPTPTPIVASSCCGMMIPSGRTIGGPGRGSQDFFQSQKPKDICVTLENENPIPIVLTFYATFSTSDGGFGFADPILSRHFLVGEMATVCVDRVRAVTVNCGGDCRMFSWRVDAAQ